MLRYRRRTIGWQLVFRKTRQRMSRWRMHWCVTSTKARWIILQRQSKQVRSDWRRFRPWYPPAWEERPRCPNRWRAASLGWNSPVSTMINRRWRCYETVLWNSCQMRRATRTKTLCCNRPIWSTNMRKLDSMSRIQVCTPWFAGWLTRQKKQVPKVLPSTNSSNILAMIILEQSCIAIHDLLQKLLGEE